MKSKNNRFSKLFILFLPISFLLSSCGSDFKSVQKFLKDQSDIKNSSDLIAQDIYGSCLRRATYIHLTTNEGIQTREDTIKECNSSNKPNVDKFQQANGVLLDYMTNISKVASGSTVSFDANISSLQTALSQLKIGNSTLPQSTVTTGTNILKILANALSTSKRRKALKKAILCSDDSLHVYITGNTGSEENKPVSGGLIRAIQDGYISDDTGILGIEKTQINTYYQTSLVELSKVSHITEQLHVEKDYNDATNIVQDKSNKAQSYIQMLQETVKAHHALKIDFQGKGKNEITPQETNELCRSVSSGTTSNLEKSNRAEKLNITEQQLSKAKVILAEYSEKIKSLNEEQ